MIETLLYLFKTLFELLKVPVYAILIFLAIFFLFVLIHFFIGLAQGKKLPKSSRKYVKTSGFLKRVFWETPKQFVADLFNSEPDFFRYQGLIIFEGRQGAGKTMSMIQFCRKMQLEYPLSKVITNLGYKYEDNKLKDWRMLMNYKNGKKGVIVVMDELQNWFSSNDSKNFPPEMLGVITQNRKNRRIILGTSQNFYLLAKAIRSQATEVRRCTTLLGCLTIVRRFEPMLDSEGNVREWKKRRYIFLCSQSGAS